MGASAPFLQVKDMIVLDKFTKEGAVHKVAIPSGSVVEVAEQLDGGCWVKYREEFEQGPGGYGVRSIKVDMEFVEVMDAIDEGSEHD